VIMIPFGVLRFAISSSPLKTLTKPSSTSPAPPKSSLAFAPARVIPVPSHQPFLRAFSCARFAMAGADESSLASRSSGGE